MLSPLVSMGVIVLKEGERKFNTYIRIANGEIESFVSYPDNFF